MKPVKKRNAGRSEICCAILLCIITAAAAGCVKDRDKRFFCHEEKFSICFPEAWKITENYKGTRIIAEIPNDEGISVIKQNVNVVVEEVRIPVTLKEYMELQIKNMQKLKGIKILRQGERTIGRNPAAWFTYSYTIHDFGYQALVYTLNKKNRFYVITGISQFNNYNKHEDRFHEIAESFKFE